MLLGSNKQLGKISEIGDLKVGEDEIKRVRETKYLGLTIDETLSWNQQYKIATRKLKVDLDSIRKLRQMLQYPLNMTLHGCLKLQQEEGYHVI